MNREIKEFLFIIFTALLFYLTWIFMGIEIVIIVGITVIFWMLLRIEHKINILGEK